MKCAHAHLNLSVMTNGSVKPCCTSKRSITTDLGKKTLNEASILDFWNSEDRKKFIQDLESGIQVPECIQCWDEEAAGKDSLRLRDNRKFADKEITKDTLPVILDLQLGALCNLKCRICNENCSTVWQIEEATLRLPHDRKTYLNQRRFVVTKESFDDNNEYLWKDIIKILPNVEKFDFAGGEPLLIDKHWEIIKTCVDNGWSKKQCVHYNTNGTVFPEKYMHLLEEFDLVDIQISSDGIGKQFEYLRHPAKFDEVESNVDKFIKASKNSKTNWKVGMCVSISAFNVWNYFDIYEHYLKKNVGIYVNMVHDERSIKILPVELRKTIISHLQSFESKYNQNQWDQDRNIVCRYLENTPVDEYHWFAWCDELKLRDTFRNESFADTFPEYWEHLKQYM